MIILRIFLTELLEKPLPPLTGVYASIEAVFLYSAPLPTEMNSDCNPTSFVINNFVTHRKSVGHQLILSGCFQKHKALKFKLNFVIFMI